jgi:lipopolysaccharide/colanic/teichoic acid biosynthesis glycosyltransferase
MNDAGLCIKRAFDVVVSLMALILLSPIYVLVAIAVWSTSSGPIFYLQERIGLHGIPFKIIKFRTMRMHAEKDMPQLSLHNDPRVTRVGKFLRKYRLDELPQFWNILRGEMSIVGPRPERRYFINQIEEQAPYYCMIYKIRPGLTSWGPIKVGYTDTLEKMIRRLNYDIVYVENMSLGLDLKIMFYTLGVIFKGKGR